MSAAAARAPGSSGGFPSCSGRADQRGHSLPGWRYLAHDTRPPRPVAALRDNGFLRPAGTNLGGQDREDDAAAAHPAGTSSGRGETRGRGSPRPEL